jgi:hypothetical protein
VTTTIAQARARAKTEPIYLVEIALLNSGPTLYLSDRTVKVGSQTYQHYLNDLSGLSDELGRYDSAGLNSDITLRFDNAAFTSGGTAYDYLIEIGDTYPFEGAAVTIQEVYLDPDGTPSAAGTLFVGVLDEPADIDIAGFTCKASGKPQAASEEWNQPVMAAGTDEAGAVKPIIYGTGVRVPALWKDKGARTTLKAAIDSTQTTGIELSDDTGFSASGTIYLDDEQISYTGISSRVLSGVTRGASSSTATSHRAGAEIMEKLPTYEALLAGHELADVTDIFAEIDGRLLRVTSGVSDTYTGGEHLLQATAQIMTEVVNSDVDINDPTHSHDFQYWSGAGSGSSTTFTPTSSPGWITNEHVGRAFKDSAGHYFYIVSNTASALTVQNNMGVTLASGSYTGEIFRTQFVDLYQDIVASYMNNSNGAILCDHDFSTNFVTNASSAWVITTRIDGINDIGDIIGAKLCVVGYLSASATTGSEIESGTFYGQHVELSGSSPSTLTTANSLTKSSKILWSDFDGINIKQYWTSGSGFAYFYEHFVRVYYIPYGVSSASTGITVTGGAIATKNVERFHALVNGYADPDGNYGGAASVVQRPDWVIKHFLVKAWGKFAAGEIDDTSFAAAGTSYASAITGGYMFALRIGEQVNPMEYLRNLAFECRSTLDFRGGKWYLDYKPDSAPAASVTFGQSDLTGQNAKFVFGKTPRQDIKNTLTARFGLRYSRQKDDGEWEGVSTATDATSVTKYGTRPANFDFIAVRSQDMADDVLALILQELKNPLLTVAFPVDFESFGLEVGDTFDLSYGLNDAAKFWCEKIDRQGKGKGKATVTGRGWY